MKFYSTEELAGMMKCNARQIHKWRKNGLIRGIKTGRGYVYSEIDIDRFWATYTGCDLSSEQNMRYAKTLRGKPS